MFAYLQANLLFGQQFHHHKGGYRQGRSSWMDADFFPIQERLISDVKSEEDAVFTVDTGTLGNSIG
jgi:hypothetical protein